MFIFTFDFSTFDFWLFDCYLLVDYWLLDYSFILASFWPFDWCLVLGLGSKMLGIWYFIYNAWCLMLYCLKVI